MLWAAFAAAAGTGTVYAWMRHLVRPVDEFAVVNHPLQPLVQHLHVLLAPLLVFAVGLVWSGHVVARWREGRGGPMARVSGITAAAGFWLMVLSGYGAQVATGVAMRGFLGWLHLGAGLAWSAAVLAHLWIGRGRRAERAPRSWAAPGPGPATNRRAGSLRGARRTG